MNIERAARMTTYVLRALPGWLFIITFCMTHAALSNHAVRAMSIRNAYAHVFIARSKTMPLREFCTESHPLSSQTTLIIFCEFLDLTKQGLG